MVIKTDKSDDFSVVNFDSDKNIFKVGVNKLRYPLVFFFFQYCASLLINIAAHSAETTGVSLIKTGASAAKNRLKTSDAHTLVIMTPNPLF